MMNITLLGDGAMGTSLLRYGNNPTMLNIENPKIVRELHKSYVSAGARILRTNSFSLDCDKNAISASPAIACIDNVEIWGSTPGTWHEYNDLYSLYLQHFKTLTDTGIRHIHIETATDPTMLETAIKAYKEINQTKEYELSVSAFISPRTHLTMPDYIAITREYGISNVALNCMPCDDFLRRSLKSLLETPHIHRVSAFPCAGSLNPTDWVTNVGLYLDDLPLYVLGGCCGTTPEHIKCLHTILDLHS